MVDPKRVHLISLKHVMRYLKVTVDYGLEHVADSEIGLLGYLNSNWVGSVSNWKIRLGSCFTLGSGMISWINKKQSCVALNTTEAEYVASCAKSREAVWLQILLTILFDTAMEATCILCDNQSCVKLSENLVFHDRLKHIEIRYHYIRDMVQKGVVRLQYVATDEKFAYVLTNPLSRMKFEYFRDKLDRGSDGFICYCRVVDFMMKCCSYWRDTQWPWIHVEEMWYKCYRRVLDVMHKDIRVFCEKVDSFMITCCSYWRDIQ